MKKTQETMKIGNDIYRKTKIDDVVEIEGGPRLRVKGLPAYVCKETDDVMMDATTTAQRDQAIVSHLLKHYSDLEIPGRIATFIRNTIGLTFTEWARLSRLDTSTLSRAATRDTAVDHYAALVLTLLASDFVMGGKRGRTMIDQTQRLGEQVDRPELRSVEVA